jgi:hypothetical protein
MYNIEQQERWNMTGSDVLHAGLNVHRIDVGLGVLHVGEGSQADGTWREISVSGRNERKSWKGWTSPASLHPCTPAPAPCTQHQAPCPLRTLPLHPGHRGDKLQQLPNGMPTSPCWDGYAAMAVSCKETPPLPGPPPSGHELRPFALVILYTV